MQTLNAGKSWIDFNVDVFFLSRDNKTQQSIETTNM
jgi:hypothetical protein